MSAFKVSFVIPTRNAARDIEQCLTSLMPYYEQGYVADIVIVDGQSRDDTVAKASRFPVKIVTDASGFPGPSWDLCWRHAAGDIVVYLDSDAYLGEGFLPRLLDYFADDAVGLVGCEFFPVTDDGRFSKAEKDWTAYSWQTRFSPRGPVQKFFRRFTLGKGGVPPARGPCWAARRKYIAAVDGYRGLPARMPPDAALPHRLTAQGWQTRWFLGSQVFHYARATFRSQIKRCVRDGRDGAAWQKGLHQSSARQLLSIAPELGGPVVGFFAALRRRNPWVFVFSFTRYAVIAGCIREIFSPPVQKIE